MRSEIDGVSSRLNIRIEEVARENKEVERDLTHLVLRVKSENEDLVSKRVNSLEEHLRLLIDQNSQKHENCLKVLLEDHLIVKDLIGDNKKYKSLPLYLEFIDKHMHKNFEIHEEKIQLIQRAIDL